MKKNDIVIVSITVCATVILFGLLTLLPLSGCNGTPCCPYIFDFHAEPKIICETGCFDNAGQTSLYATVGYHRDEQPCDPDGGTKIEIRDKSTNSLWPNTHLTKTQTAGLHKATINLDNLNKNITFQLDAYGEKGCPVESKDTDEIIVLKDKYHHELCTSSGDLHGNCIWDIKNNISGKNIFIEEIRYPQRNGVTNKPNKYSITVTYKNKSISMLPGNKSSVLKGLDPNDNWTIQITSSEECKMFMQKPEDFCIILVLKCKCEE